MSIYKIGEITNPRNRRSVAQEVTWNDNSGVVKVGFYETGKANNLYAANGVAIKEARNNRDWFEKSEKREVYWYNNLKNQFYSAVYLRRDSGRTKLFTGESAQIKIEGNWFFVSMKDFKESRHDIYINGKEYQMSFSLDSVGGDGFGRNGASIINARDDAGVYWSLTLSR